jgi:periplasmic divalent cation tolerance protein
MSKQVMVVLSTAPDEDAAANLAAALIEARLAACVNIVPGVRSLYWWGGAVQDDAEVLMICKTDAELVDTLAATITEKHPYDCPEVVALPVAGGSGDYLSWVSESLGR